MVIVILNELNTTAAIGNVKGNIFIDNSENKSDIVATIRNDKGNIFENKNSEGDLFENKNSGDKPKNSALKDIYILSRSLFSLKY
ncbi:37662_t:CDS:2 [Gigaspora margarita]|uniref:37662_t:CDS:1 n=1 Tax=Gigaspora margarita TaxID=4874 RepID=A0ABN7VQ61_GIGMA|nr:37662_t:CDS:2 [Gigaspora margarita]